MAEPQHGLRVPPKAVRENTGEEMPDHLCVREGVCLSVCIPRLEITSRGDRQQSQLVLLECSLHF